MIRPLRLLAGCRVLSLALLSLSAPLLTDSAAAATHDKVSVAPVPDWVIRYQVTPEAPIPEEAAQLGSYYLVFDEQHRISASSPERSVRIAKKVLSTGGLQRSTEVSIDFDPSYQRLQLHSLSLRRGTQTIEVLHLDELRLIQREQELDSQIYDGTLTAIVFLKDLRIGDIIDYAYTVVGANPVLQGHFADSTGLQFSVPVGMLRYRIVFPNDHGLRYRAHRCDLAPEVERNGRETTWTWQLHDIAAAAVEDSLPGWYQPHPWIQITDFASWQALVDWALPLYQRPRGSKGELEEAVAPCRRQQLTGDELIACVVRLVQDEVRYLGLEIGPNSYLPHPPALVLERRFGDCKDKSLLLISLLELLGVDAAPALVDVDTRRQLDSWLPSPYAFDHVIVRIVRAPEPVWVDSTHSLQGGTLSTMARPPFQRALVIHPDTTRLVEIPGDATPGSRKVTDHYRVKPGGAGAELQVTTIYTGSEADAMRRILASSSLSDLGKDYLNFYAQDDAGIELVAPLQVSDDRQQNVITIGEHYRLPVFWRQGRRYFDAYSVARELDEPQTRLRSMPLAINHPIEVRHTITVDLPEQVPVAPNTTRVETDSFRLLAVIRRQGRTITLDCSYTSKSDAVIPDAVGRHLRAIDRAEEALGLSITSPRARAQGSGSRTAARGLALWLVVLLLALGAGIFVRRILPAWRRSRAAWRMYRFRRAALLRKGEDPQQPLIFKTEAQAEAHLGSLRCHCGAATDASSELRDQITLGGDAVVAVVRPCTRCQGEARLYYRLADG